MPENTKKVWINLKTQEKPMLVELEQKEIDALDIPGTIIHGKRTNQEGEISRVGFSTDNISSYNYKEEQQSEF